jgi:hypothetical protein
MANSGKGLGLGAVSIGLLFVYGGLKGYSPLKALQNIIQGKPASIGQSSNALTSGGTNNSPISAPNLGSYSNSAAAKLWVQEGGNPAKASIAACIVSHESGGNAAAESANPDGGTNVGLYQLDTPGGKGAGYTIEQLKDPATNTRVAIQASSNGQDWSAWSTAPMCGV